MTTIIYFADVTKAQAALKEKEMLYEYSFCIWPDEKWGFPKEIFEVFECLKGRVAFTWTEEHFNKVRSRLSHYGLVMHEISRKLYEDEEIIL